MPSRLLRLKANLPLHLEHRLVTKWGFAVDKRISGDYTIFKKSYISDKEDDGVKRTIRATVNNDNVVTVHFEDAELSHYRKKQLEKELENIVHMFPDPNSVVESVRARLMIKMQKLTAAEARFAQRFMDENFPAQEITVSGG